MEKASQKSSKGTKRYKASQFVDDEASEEPKSKPAKKAKVPPKPKSWPKSNKAKPAKTSKKKKKVAEKEPEEAEEAEEGECTEDEITDSPVSEEKVLVGAGIGSSKRSFSHGRLFNMIQQQDDEEDEKHNSVDNTPRNEDHVESEDDEDVDADNEQKTVDPVKQGILDELNKLDSRSSMGQKQQWANLGLMYKVSLTQLAAGIISVCYQRNGHRVTNYPRIALSPQMKAILTTLLVDKQPIADMVKTLNQSEKTLLNSLFVHAKVEDAANILGYEPNELDQTILKELPKIVGEIKAGNNNPQLRVELLSIIDYLFDKNRLNTVEYRNFSEIATQNLSPDDRIKVLEQTRKLGKVIAEPKS